MENNTHSEQLNELFAALSRAQAHILSAKKDSNNPFFKSKFADLSSVWEAIRKPLTDNGLSIIQTCDGVTGSMCLVTWLGHSSGQWMKSRIPIAPAKSDPQSLGSYITYMRRYALSAIVGVVSDEDDDGEAAMKHARQAPVKAPVPQPVVEKKVTHHEAELLTEMLAKDPEFKDSVETFILETLGQNAIIDLKYKDYEKIYKRTKQHLEEKEKMNE